MHGDVFFYDQHKLYVTELETLIYIFILSLSGDYQWTQNHSLKLSVAINHHGVIKIVRNGAGSFTFFPSDPKLLNHLKKDLFYESISYRIISFIPNVIDNTVTTYTTLLSRCADVVW